MKPEIVVIPLRNRHQILAGSNVKAGGLDDTDILFPINPTPGIPWTGGN